MNLKKALGLRYAPVAKNLATNIASDIHQTLDLAIARELSKKIASDAGVTVWGARLGDFVRRWHWQSRLIKWAAIGNLFVCVFASVDWRLNPYARIMLLTAGCGSVLVGKQSHQSAKSSLAIATTLAQIEGAEAGMKIAQLSKPVVIEKPMVMPTVSTAVKNDQVELSPEPLKLFDWNLFNTKPGKYAHLAICAETGGGKSYTAERIASKIFTQGKTLVIAPHKKPGEWKGLETFCGGRNYGKGTDEPINIQHLILEGCDIVSVASFIKGLELEMDRRYKLYGQGIEDYPFLNIIWDETLAALDEIPKLIQPTLKLLREARKVCIRLAILIQDDAVKSLKLEGQGAARKNLTYIRQGEFALPYAKKLGDEQLIEWVKRQEYPCLVEGMAAVVP